MKQADVKTKIAKEKATKAQEEADKADKKQDQANSDLAKKSPTSENGTDFNAEREIAKAKKA